MWRCQIMQMRSELISIVKLEIYTSPCGLIFKLVSIKHGLRTADCGLRTTDWGLGIKHGLDVKYGLRTEYKTWTRYKMRTTDYVYKNSFRKGKTERNGKLTSKNSSPCFNISLAVHVVYPHRQGRLCQYSRQSKLNSEFYENKELEEISIYSFKPIRSTG